MAEAGEDGLCPAQHADAHPRRDAPVPRRGMGAWLPLCMLCLAAILREPETRLPACMVLFATAGGCCYPATGETLLRPFYAFALCAAALFMLLGVIPGAKTSEVKADD